MIDDQSIRGQEGREREVLRHVMAEQTKNAMTVLRGEIAMQKAIITELADVLKGEFFNQDGYNEVSAHAAVQQIIDDARETHYRSKGEG